MQARHACRRVMQARHAGAPCMQARHAGASCRAPCRHVMQRRVMQAPHAAPRAQAHLDLPPEVRAAVHAHDAPRLVAQLRSLGVKPCGRVHTRLLRLRREEGGGRWVV
eukprot:356175-Chlamydomonas_euryale.AAC.3